MVVAPWDGWRVLSWARTAGEEIAGNGEEGQGQVGQSDVSSLSSSEAQGRRESRRRAPVLDSEVRVLNNTLDWSIPAREPLFNL